MHIVIIRYGLKAYRSRPGTPNMLSDKIPNLIYIYIYIYNATSGNRPGVPRTILHMCLIRYALEAFGSRPGAPNRIHLCIPY